jgi:hypothetical protein
MSSSPAVRNYLRQLLLMVKRLALCYAAYFLCRLLFLVVNRHYFPGVGILAFLENSFYGLRFDSFSIVAASSLFILLSALPFRFVARQWYQKLLLVVFLIPNVVFIAFNLVDVAYYEFTRKRSTAEIFEQITGQSDILKLLPQFLADYWWDFIAFVLLIVVLIKFYPRFKSAGDTLRPRLRDTPVIFLLFSLTCGLGTLAVRGGLQRVPIDIVSAGAVTRVDEVPVVLNSPFTIIKSMNQKALTEYAFFTEPELKKILDPVHRFNKPIFRKRNVVVIILESFLKEYTSLARSGSSMTPFLDSLMAQGLVCTNGFSNGTKSIEGIPAILSGLPSIMENPFINSLYANNRQASLATLLGQEGYESAFFHGGINGTMNFDDWAATAGYDHYFGKDEYGNDEDFDGYWGIWDEPFLQFAAKKINSMREPFHASVFTLSSHHPWFVPEQYKKLLADGPYENSRSIRYADLALRKFFETASRQKWFNNTLFVLTADHGSLSERPFYSTSAGNQSIPILFFEPGGGLSGAYAPAFSQIDILPSVLKILGYNKSFFAFGEPIGSGKPHNTYNYAYGVNSLYTDSMFFRFINGDLRETYNYYRDSALSRSVVGQYPREDSVALLRYRAFIQTYNHVLNNNKMTAQ